MVILITAHGTTETAVEAMKQGAYDYITKPFKVDEMRLVVGKASRRAARARTSACAGAALAHALAGRLERRRCGACTT